MSQEESQRGIETVTGLIMVLAAILVILSTVLILYEKRPLLGSLGAQFIEILAFVVFGGTFLTYRHVVSLSTMMDEETNGKIKLEQARSIAKLIIRMMLLTGISLVLAMEIIFVEEPPLLGYLGTELTAVSLLIIFGFIYLMYRRVLSTWTVSQR